MFKFFWNGPQVLGYYRMPTVLTRWGWWWRHHAAPDDLAQVRTQCWRHNRPARCQRASSWLERNKIDKSWDLITLAYWILDKSKIRPFETRNHSKTGHLECRILNGLTFEWSGPELVFIVMLCLSRPFENQTLQIDKYVGYSLNVNTKQKKSVRQ